MVYQGKFWHWFTHKACFRGKELRPGKSRDPVNRGTVNRGFTVMRKFPKFWFMREKYNISKWDFQNLWLLDHFSAVWEKILLNTSLSCYYEKSQFFEWLTIWLTVRLTIRPTLCPTVRLTVQPSDWLTDGTYKVWSERSTSAEDCLESSSMHCAPGILEREENFKI